MRPKSIAIIGAGPAGLTAAYELVKTGLRPIILEKGDKVGGLARTETHRGYRFDIGGHRFYTKVPEVAAIWRHVLGKDLLRRQRLSRILYNGRYYKYPLSPTNTLGNLGPIESTRILASYIKWQMFPYRNEETFEHWVTNRFGRRLYRTFFKTYTEKVWGIPCNVIRADWAAQRIKDLSLRTVITNSLFGANGVKSLIEEFDYPRLGPGMMWNRMREIIEQRDGQVQLESEVVAVRHDGRRITSIMVQHQEKLSEIQADEFITSMPMAHLLFRLKPQPPDWILQAARNLNYRDFIMVMLIIDQAMIFPDNWIYVHDPGAKVGRIQNFKNWSPEMVPDQQKTSLGLEYFCTKGDSLWSMSDDDLVKLASSELANLGLASEADVEDGVVIRQRKAYPVYDVEYLSRVKAIAAYLDRFTNLQTIGRNGMHRYNNQDHSMLTGLLAVRNILGERYNLWDVNTERSYYEEVVLATSASQVVSQPGRGCHTLLISEASDGH